MFPDTPEGYKTPIVLKIVIFLFVLIVSGLIAVPLAFIFTGVQ